MKTFSFVEDYLEVLNGDRDLVTGKLHGLFLDTPPIVNLARYDVKILDSMSQQTQCGNALTDRQAELACKMIVKYKKQLAAKGIDVAPIENPMYRMPLRIIDRRKLIKLEAQHIVLKFPFETKLIDQIRDMAKDSAGRWKWQSEAKEWQVALTETNVVAVCGIGKANDFEIDPELIKLEDAITKIESQPYAIELTQQFGKLVITNAQKTLIDAVVNECALAFDNLHLLIDKSATFGYTVDDLLCQSLVTKHGSRITNLIIAQETKFAPTNDDSIFQDIINYAELVNRYPIYVYEPDMSGRLYENFVKKFFNNEHIIQTQTLAADVNTATTKVIYFNKYNAKWNKAVPLLISGQGMMHGGEKTLLLQQAEKVVYFATEVYNVNTMKRKH